MKSCCMCNKEFKPKSNRQMCCNSKCSAKRNASLLSYKNTVKKYQKKYSTTTKRRYSKLRSECLHKKWSFDISYDQYCDYLDKGCFYCSTSLLLETGKCLDRIDNSKKYTNINVIPCCGTCNKIKNNFLSVIEMKIAMSAILNYRKKNKGA